VISKFVSINAINDRNRKQVNPHFIVCINTNHEPPFVYIFARMRFNEDAIILLCQDVKTHGDFTYSKGNKQVTHDMVIGFNYELFTDIISPDSTLYDVDI